MKKASSNFLESFQDFLLERGASQRTIEAYTEDVMSYCTWHQQSQGSIPKPEEITSIDLREYQSYLRNNRSMKPASLNRRLIGLKSYLKWAEEVGYIDRLPTFPKLARQQKSPPKALERKEQNRLLRQVERKAKARDTALIRLMLSCGLRVGEVVSLKTTDINMGERQGFVTVRSGKGFKWREVPVPNEARKAIQEWLEEREQKKIETEWLFPSRDCLKDPLSIRRVEQILTDYAQRSGIENLTPHTLRHTAATNMIQSGADIVTVATVLGHESLDTTMVYTRPGKRVMTEALEKSEM
ncbi:tyrosine-type recombinase/integrase [Heliorestis convoluta]|uniref:Integrase family protein n=1 Tax=Heliorestis convoluta TaxID=356322 RepID=A0A5Q2N9B4_9FIRM|nr:tyrosine-type recombinase/integrase [Heliorestis convoluta]QGG48860.1 integrase family protein [Heliorestis convoluta]